MCKNKERWMFERNREQITEDKNEIIFSEL